MTKKSKGSEGGLAAERRTASSGSTNSIPTELKLTRELIHYMAEMNPGTIGIYLYLDGRIETLYFSPSLPSVLGMTAEEYERVVQKNAIGIVWPADREALVKAVEKLITNESGLDTYYRVQHRTRGFDWVHAIAKVCGQMEGGLVLFASFFNASVETDIYQEILDNTERMIYVCDRDTHEILYSNKPAHNLHGDGRDAKAGTPCYESVRGNSAPCEDCPMRAAEFVGGTALFEKFETIDDTEVRITGRSLNWCGHEAFVHYIDDVSVLRRAERDAVKHRQMYESAVEDAKLVVWEYDIVHHRVTMFDNNFTKYDYRKFALPKIIENAPQSLVGYIDEGSVDVFLEMYRKIEAGAPKASCEVWYKFKPGQEPRCERITYTTVYDEDGKPVTAFGIGQNITAAKNAEAHYEQAYHQLISSSQTVASFRLNLTKDWVGEGQSRIPSVLEQQKAGTVNAYFSEFAKLIADDKVKEWFFTVFDREKLLEGFRRGKTEITFEYPVIYEDGTRHWSEGRLYLIQNHVTGDVEGTTYAIAIDDRKYSELMTKVLSNAMFGFAIMLDMATGKILFGGLTDPNGEERYRNEDYTPAMIAALRKMMTPEALDDAIKLHSIENIRAQLEKRDRFELTLVTKNGRHLRWNIAYVDRDQSIVLIIREDITEVFRKQQQMIGRLEDALDSAERANQSEQVFLSSMSHDMRTPLNGVLGFTELALKADDIQRKQDYLRKIGASGELMLNLVNDILDLSKIDSGKMEMHLQAFESRGLFDAVVDPMRLPAKERGLSLAADMDESYPRFILTDRLRLQQIALNLLSNAIKYTPDGGTISFGVHRWKKPGDACNTLFEVQDTGIGMSREFQKRMFEPFSQEHQSRVYGVQGTGLGLSIVSRLVDLMGGRIEVDSELSKGTKFSIYLPIETAEMEGAPDDGTHMAKADVSGRRFLLCEDNELNREIAETILRERGGAEVECAIDGKEGLDKFAASKPGYYDAILMDIRMPVMDGLSASRAIRALSRPDAKAVPIIAMTADAFAEDVQRCLDAGMDAHVPKPIKPDLLLATIAKQLRHGGDSDRGSASQGPALEE